MTGMSALDPGVLRNQFPGIDERAFFENAARLYALNRPSNESPGCRGSGQICLKLNVRLLCETRPPQRRPPTPRIGLPGLNHRIGSTTAFLR